MKKSKKLSTRSSIAHIPANRWEYDPIPSGECSFYLYENGVREWTWNVPDYLKYSPTALQEIFTPDDLEKIRAGRASLISDTHYDEAGYRCPRVVYYLCLPSYLTIRYNPKNGVWSLVSTTTKLTMKNVLVRCRSVELLIKAQGHTFAVWRQAIRGKKSGLTNVTYRASTIAGVLLTGLHQPAVDFLLRTVFGMDCVNVPFRYCHSEVLPEEMDLAGYPRQRLSGSFEKQYLAIFNPTFLEISDSLYDYNRLGGALLPFVKETSWKEATRQFFGYSSKTHMAVARVLVLHCNFTYLAQPAEFRGGFKYLNTSEYMDVNFFAKYPIQTVHFLAVLFTQLSRRINGFNMANMRRSRGFSRYKSSFALFLKYFPRKFILYFGIGDERVLAAFKQHCSGFDISYLSPDLNNERYHDWYCLCTDSLEMLAEIAAHAKGAEFLTEFGSALDKSNIKNFHDSLVTIYNNFQAIAASEKAATDLIKPWQSVHDKIADRQFVDANGNVWTLALPDTGKTLMYWGISMHHCIANYFNHHFNRSCLLLGLHKDGELMFNIQLSRELDGTYALHQFYGKYNALSKSTEPIEAFVHLFKPCFDFDLKRLVASWVQKLPV